MNNYNKNTKSSSNTTMMMWTTAAAFLLVLTTTTPAHAFQGVPVSSSSSRSSSSSATALHMAAAGSNGRRRTALHYVTEPEVVVHELTNWDRFLTGAPRKRTTPPPPPQQPKPVAAAAAPATQPTSLWDRLLNRKQQKEQPQVQPKSPEPLVVVVVEEPVEKEPAIIVQVQEDYLAWCARYQKQPDEVRFLAFVDNYLAMREFVHATGRENVVLNEFADCTPQEYQLLQQQQAVRRAWQ